MPLRKYRYMILNCVNFTQFFLKKTCIQIVIIANALHQNKYLQLFLPRIETNMGTFSRTLIKGIAKEQMLDLVRAEYPIGRVEILDHENNAIFFDRKNYPFVLFDAYLSGWTEMVLEFRMSAAEHDGFLSGISGRFETTVIFGYNQTTTGDARFTVFKNGHNVRSIYQKSEFGPHRIITVEDFGSKFPYEQHFTYPPVGEDTTRGYLLDYEDIQEMFKDAGYTGPVNLNSDEKYYHLEWINE